MSFLKDSWKKVSYIGIDNTTPKSEEKRVKVLNQINVFLFLATPFYIVIHLFTDWRLSVLLFVVGIGFLSNLIYNHYKKYAWAKVSTYLWFWLTVVVFCFFIGKGSAIHHTFYLLGVLPFILYSSKKKWRVFFMVSFATISFLAFVYLEPIYELDKLVVLTPEQQHWLVFPVICTVFIVLSMLISTLILNSETSESKLLKAFEEMQELVGQTEKQNEMLAEKEKTLQNSLKEINKNQLTLVEKNNELQSQEEEMRQTVEELTSVNEQMKQQEDELKLQIDANKLQLYQIEQQEELMRETMEELQEKNEQMEAQEAIMVQAMEDLNKSNEQLQASEQHLESEVKRRTAQIESQNKVLSNSYKELEEKTLALRQSINYAKHIQSAILPPKHIIKALFPESFIFYRPRDVVSGDFYWINRRVTQDGNTKIAIAAIDCTGHGVPGAIMSMIGYNLLNQYANETTLSEPHLLIEKLHEGIIQSLQQRQTEGHDGMDLSLCVYDKSEKRVDFVGAKNPLIYIQDNQLNEVKGDNMSVGGVFFIKQERRFTKHSIAIDQPTHLYIYSDGYQDQFGGENNRKFMKSRFKELLLRVHHLPTNEQRTQIAKTFDTWKGHQNQIDDVLVMGFKLEP